MAFEWNQRNIQHLREMWAKGLTASAIARNLGAPSRDSVMGKVHRLGLCGRPSPILPKGSGKRPHQKRRQEAAARRAAKPAPKPEPRLPLLVIPRKRQAPVVADAGAVPFRALVSGQCRWIAGPTVPGRAHEVMACGAPVADIGCPYCSEHRARAAGKAAAPAGNLAAIDNWSPTARAPWRRVCGIRTTESER